MHDVHIFYTKIYGTVFGLDNILKISGLHFLIGKFQIAFFYRFD